MSDVKEEPSIEEILGSIRRIIAEDEDGAAPAAAEETAPQPAPVEEEEEPLELTNKIETTADVAPAMPIEDVAITFEESTPAPAMTEEVVPMSEETELDSLISDSAANATVAVMSQLARHTAITEEGHDGITIENIVREMLKPMLRDWLDKNLPDIVQKMVARELDRLSKRV